MRLLHVVPSYLPAYRYGGPIYSVHGLCSALSSRGHDTHVFTTNVDGSKDTDVPLGQPVNVEGVKVWYFPSRHFRRLFWSPPMAREIKCRIDRFDLVHLHSIFLWPTWVAARMARRYNIPYLMAPRGMLTKDLITRKSTIAKMAWIRLIERNNLEKAAGIHVTTDIEARECNRFRFSLPPFYKVPNGIDSTFTDKPLTGVGDTIKEIVNKKPFLLFLSRINWKKGLDRLIPALSEIPHVHLVISGNDEEDYTSFLIQLAKENNVSDRITFTGPVYDGDKRALLKSAIVFVLPSYSENFGNVILEAMASGCPIAVTPEVGLADTVEKSGSGIVVNGEPSTLAAGLNPLIANGPLRRKMGQSGRRVVKEQFNWPSIAAEMESVYLEITNTHREYRRNNNAKI